MKLYGKGNYRLIGKGPFFLRYIEVPYLKGQYLRLKKSMSQDSAGDTIFSKIIRKEIPADIVYEDDLCLAFRDINAQAPTHILVIPKKKIPRLADATAEDKELLGHMLLTVKSIAEQEELRNGYRVVINTDQDGGQTVFHLHMHLMGGRSLAWPPG